MERRDGDPVKLPMIQKKKQNKSKAENKPKLAPGVPLAAGIPVSETLRRMEIEKLITRDERIALLQLCRKSESTDPIFAEIQKLELNSMRRATLNHLKSLVEKKIARRSKMKRLSFDPPVPDRKSAIEQCVGDCPIYSEVASKGNYVKFHQRLNDFVVQYSLEKAKKTTFVIIVGSGSFNPVTRKHLRNFYIAKQCIESSSDMFVLGSLLSPSHHSLVRQKFRTCPSDILPAPHRLAITQLSVKDSIWVSVDPWEITRRRVMDYLSVLEHTARRAHSEFPGFNIKIMYLCKHNMIPNLSAKALKQSNYGVVCVCRAPESDMLRSSIGHEWKHCLWVAEDTAIIDASMEKVSSRNVRAAVREMKPLEHLVGKVVSDYFKANKIGQKMNGSEKWSKEEKYLPKILSRKEERADKNVDTNVISSRISCEKQQTD